MLDFSHLFDRINIDFIDNYLSPTVLPAAQQQPCVTPRGVGSLKKYPTLLLILPVFYQWKSRQIGSAVQEFTRNKETDRQTKYLKVSYILSYRFSRKLIIRNYKQKLQFYLLIYILKRTYDLIEYILKVII